jgi:glycosyltransferase involved in cell wall biosynthesis
VLFVSEHARRDAITEDLIEPQRTAVAGIGIDRPGPHEPPRQPDGVPPGRPLLVMIGADYLHKNRVFALELVGELRRRHGWDGLLVMVGARVVHGSSAEAEAQLLRADPELAAHVLDLGPVPEAEKQWLLQHGQALLCPSTYEGYGLTPLEAGAAGMPCIYAATTSLSEVVGAEAATIVPWDAPASADAVIALLGAGEERERHLALLSQALGRCDWEPIVDRICQVYAEAISSPFRASNPRAWEDLKREQRLAEVLAEHQQLESRVTHGLPLIDRGGLLTRAQQRGLMRIAARRWLRGPVLGPIGLLGNLRPDEPREGS